MFQEMKKVNRLLYLVLVVLVGITSSKDAKAQKKESSLLWKVTGQGLEEPSYLYGTIHIICPDDFELGERVSNAFTSAEKIVMELDMDNLGEMGGLQQLMISKEPVDYKGLLTEEQYKRMDEILTSRMGAGMSFLKVMKPFALSSLLQLSVLDCAQPASYENSFTEMAKNQGKEILGLETASFQMSIFDAIPLNEQISWITEHLDNEVESKKTWREMVEMYKSQDVEALAKSLNDYPEYKKYEDELLTKRNERWIPQILEMARENPVFVAVGAAHLGGKGGVISLLKKAGYKVTPVLK